MKHLLFLLTGFLFLAPQATTQSWSQSRSFGMSLPSSPSYYGSDEIRAADGTTCRSSMSGNGPKLDFGGIRSPDQTDGKNFSAVYGRIVMPLTKQPKRLDCYNLYQLELDRLKHELEMAKGLGGDQMLEDISGDWANEGWGDGEEEKDEKKSD